MADGTVLNAGSGGDTIRNKDRGSAKTSISLIDVGGASAEALVGDSGVQLPIKGSGTAGTAATGVVTVQGIASMTPVQTSPIPGQVGVTGGVGVVVANTLRVNLGTDDLAVTSLAVMDDWDESDRAKVNPIVGVAGVAAGAGAVSTTVQRMTLASDDPAVTALQILDNTVSGSEMQVDVVAALPAGDNNIGNVDVVTMPTVTIQDGGGSITVDGTLSLSGSVDTELPAAAALADNTANPTAPAVGSFVHVWDGATWDRAPGTSADGTLVNLGANNDVTVTSGAITETNSAAIKTAVEILDNAISGSEMQVDVVAALPTGANVIGAVTQSGTWNVGTVTTVTGVTTVTTVSTVTAVSDAQVQGKAAHDAAASGNPVLLGAYASAAAPTAVSLDGDAVRLWADLSGRLQIGDGGSTISIDDGAGAITVDGTVTANLAAGTNNIGDVDILSIAAGDNNIGNVDIVTMPAVTNAGTFVVQENGAALTALQLIDDTVATLGTTTYTEATTKGLTIGAVRRDADTTLVGTTNEIGPLQMDANGYLKVEIFDGGGSHTVDNGGTFVVQVDGTALTRLTDIETNTDSGAVVGNGAAATAQRVTIANDSTGILAGVTTVTTVTTVSTVSSVSAVIPGTGATNLGKAEDVGHTTGDTGVYALAVRDDSPAAHSGTDGDYESLHVNAEGGLWVSPTPSASGGLSIFRSLDLDETEEDVKTSAGTVYGAWVTNTATSTRWLKFYNATAANTTVGSTTPVITIGIPGNTSDDISGHFAAGGHGIAFGTAICVAATTGVADADTGAPAANDVICNIFYK